MAQSTKPVAVAPPRKLDPVHLLTGSISGSISRTVTNPLERLKMLKQVSVGEYQGLNTVQSFKYMWKNEGVYGFFKGNGVNVVRIAPFSAFEFFFYDLYKNNIFSGDSAGNLAKLCCGGMTGMTASTLTYPLDLIRTKLSISVADAGGVKPSIYGTGLQIYQAGGFIGLYRGLPSTLFGITPYIGIKMATFDILKTFFVVDRNHPNAQIMNLLLGGLAGTVAVSLTYPTDLLRRMMQLSGTKGHPTYDNMFDAAAKIVKKEGPVGLYKGYIACLLKVAPSMAILFWCNEMLKEKFGR